MNQSSNKLIHNTLFLHLSVIQLQTRWTRTTTDIHAASAARCPPPTLVLSADSPRKGFISFDGLFSILPALLILIFTMNIANHLIVNAQEHIHSQQTFDKIVSIADYTVKQGAVIIDDAAGLRYPNLIDESKMTNNYEEDLRVKSNLNSLDITMDDPGEGSVCIYRIVLDPQDQIRQLYVCGD